MVLRQIAKLLLKVIWGTIRILLDVLVRGESLVVVGLLQLTLNSPLLLPGTASHLVQISIYLSIEHIIIFNLPLGVYRPLWVVHPHAVLRPNTS